MLKARKKENKQKKNKEEKESEKVPSSRGLRREMKLERFMGKGKAVV